MSKLEYISRYLIIINFLKRGRASWSEIANHLQTQSENMGYNYEISQRTFQREIAEIRSLHGIDIQNNKTTGQYYIAEEEELNNNAQLLDAFYLFNALSLSNNYTNYIQFENRIPQGTEHIYGLLHAIKNKVAVEISYHKFYEAEAQTVLLHPYLIKQFKGRWYLLAIKAKTNQVRTYALDRIKNLDISKKKFTPEKNLDLKNYFNNYFGIITPDTGKPEKITFSADSFQSNYFKTFPLHASQRIVKENTDESIFEITVFITHDLIMELLSHGEDIAVLSRKKLVSELKEIYKGAAERLN